MRAAVTIEQGYNLSGPCRDGQPIINQPPNVSCNAQDSTALTRPTTVAGRRHDVSGSNGSERRPDVVAWCAVGPTGAPLSSDFGSLKLACISVSNGYFQP